MFNVQTKFDILEGVNVKDILTYDNKKHKLQDLLLNVKIGKAPIFVRVE